MKRATGIHKSGSCDVITNARTWGVHVIQLDKFLDRLARYVSKEKVGTKHVANDREIKASGKPKVRQLKAPFIKVEDLSRQYRPLVHELKEWPRMYFDSPVGTCPFDRPRQGAHASQVRQKSYKYVILLHCTHPVERRGNSYVLTSLPLVSVRPL